MFLWLSEHARDTTSFSLKCLFRLEEGATKKTGIQKKNSLPVQIFPADAES